MKVSDYLTSMETYSILCVQLGFLFTALFLPKYNQFNYSLFVQPSIQLRFFDRNSLFLLREFTHIIWSALFRFKS